MRVLTMLVTAIAFTACSASVNPTLPVSPVSPAALPFAGVQKHLYTANRDGTSGVLLFRQQANGDVAPSWTIGGSRSNLGPTEGLFIDPSENLYVTDFENDAVREYPAGKHGNVAPIRSIKGSKTKLNSPTGMAMDSHGTLYIANTHGASIVAFASTKKGNVAPTVVISGSNTGLQRPLASRSIRTEGCSSPTRLRA